MEFTDYLRFLAALAFVVGLIEMLALGARRFGMTPRITRKRGQRGSRLSIVDMMPVDGKRRLVLLRRDNVEHLVMLRPNTETLIESGIDAEQTPSTGRAPSGEDDDQGNVGLRGLPSLSRFRLSGD